MKCNERHIATMLAVLLAISAVIRCILAATIEFGNDEVYYWTYALYPDWSHFDHPSMVGWMIQFFTLNLRFDSEFCIRLASIVIMTLNTYLVFRIAKEIKDAQTGLYAALLYTGSIYAFVITGIFILPDTPESLFWLLAFWIFARFFKADGGRNSSLLLAGLFAGLCMLSKYTGVFLWIGAGLYILLFDRKQLRNPYLYGAILISAVCCLPILIWNLNYDFVSFRFHGERVSLFGSPKFNFLGTELGGEFIYNNPVNVVLAILAIIALARHKLNMQKSSSRLILCIALPLILMFWFFSMTRQTLPHWTAPAYNLLIFLSACWLSDRNAVTDNHFRIPAPIIASVTFLLLTVGVGTAEIKTGFIPLDRHPEGTELGKNDFTLDMYGWRQLESKFATLRDEKIAQGEMTENDAIIGYNWFPMANIDYYVARPLGMKVLGYGPLDKIHKYLWINEKRGGFNKDENYWYITDSHYFNDPNVIYNWVNFHEIVPAGTIDIERNGKVVKHAYVFMCKKLVYGPSTLQETMEKSRKHHSN